jgi:hypothetical protein
MVFVRLLKIRMDIFGSTQNICIAFTTKRHHHKNDTNNSTFYNRIKSIGCLDGKKDGDLNEFLSIIKDNSNNLWIAIYVNGVWK